MDEFEIAWDAARYNPLYYLGYAIAPCAVLIGAITRSKIFFSLALIASVVCTFIVVCIAIQYKWELRADAARTDEQMEAVAMSDTGNLAFAPFIAAFQGIMLTGILAVPGLLLLQFLRRSKQISDVPRIPSDPERTDDGNPYRPPT